MMRNRTQFRDMDAARQAFLFGQTSYRKDREKGSVTRNPYLAGSLFYTAFEKGRLAATRKQEAGPSEDQMAGMETDVNPGLTRA